MYIIPPTLFFVLALILMSDGSSGLTNHHQRHNHHRFSRGSSVDGALNTRHRRADNRMDSVFVSRNGTIVRAHIGSTATLSCVVKDKSQYGMITWARLEDQNRPYSVLTVGDSTYIDDKRILVSKPLQQNKRKDWALQIKKITQEDAGRYECQATTHPPQSIVAQLKVVEAFAVILGSKEKTLTMGSKLQLHCILKRATEKPLYIFWFHGNEMITFNSDRGVVVTNEKGSSTLTLHRPTKKEDSGNYTCSPYNIRPASVTVRITEEPPPRSEGKDSAAAAAVSKSSTDTKTDKGAPRPPPPSAAVHSSGVKSTFFGIWILCLSLIL